MKMVRSVILCLLKRLLLLVLLLFFWNYISNMTDYVTNSNKESLYISPMESGKNVGASTSRKRNHCLSSHDFCVGKENANLIINRIFWSDFCESYVPKGLSRERSMKTLRNIRGQVVKVLQKGSVKMCGLRTMNAIATLEDGTIVCVRHRGRRNFDDVLAFYLSRMLQMDNVPEVVLAKVDSASDLWKSVNISALSWKNNETVSMARQIPDVTSSVYAPQSIVDAYWKNVTINSTSISTSHIWNSTDLVDLIQWGTMIIFDYLSGQHDRLYVWKRSQEPLFSRNLRNAVKSSRGKIWLIDNEMAFYVIDRHQIRMQSFQYKFLKTLCVFQYSLINALRELSAQPRPFQALWNYASSNELLLERNQYLTYFKEYAEQFDQRLKNIIQWIQYCDNSTKT